MIGGEHEVEGTGDGEQPEAGAEDTEAQSLPLGDEDRLPWLESADDVDFEAEEIDGGRILGFVIIGVLALAVLIGALYWFTHRGNEYHNADGALIEASKTPYKVAPENPGGKTFEGTGDSSFKVSEGEEPQAKVAQATPAAKPSVTTSASPAAPASAAPAASEPEGVGVQVGAYSTRASAEAGWSKLAARSDALKDVKHRVVEGKADIGTVYRLQAVAGDRSAAHALCTKLKASGLACQVK